MAGRRAMAKRTSNNDESMVNVCVRERERAMIAYGEDNRPQGTLDKIMGAEIVH